MGAQCWLNEWLFSDVEATELDGAPALSPARPERATRFPRMARLILPSRGAHNMQVTILKRTVQWHRVRSQAWVPTSCLWFRTFPSPLKEATPPCCG